MHAGEITLKRFAAVDLETFPSVILVKRHPAAIERSGRFGPFLRLKFQPLALDAGRRRNNASAVLHGACTGDLVVNVAAARIDLLRGCRLGNEWKKQAD